MAKTAEADATQHQQLGGLSGPTPRGRNSILVFSVSGRGPSSASFPCTLGTRLEARYPGLKPTTVCDAGVVFSGLNGYAMW